MGAKGRGSPARKAGIRACDASRSGARSRADPGPSEGILERRAGERIPSAGAARRLSFLGIGLAGDLPHAARAAGARDPGTARGAHPAGLGGPGRYRGFIPSARMRSRSVFRFIPRSSAARSWFPLVRASAPAMSGASTAASAAW